MSLKINVIAEAESFVEDIAEIKNPDLQTVVRRLTQADFLEVMDVRTDGYNEDGSGTSGAELQIRGKVNSMVAYGSKVIDLNGLIALTKHLTDAQRQVPGLEAELLVNEDGEQVLLVMGDAD